MTAPEIALMALQGKNCPTCEYFSIGVWDDNRYPMCRLGQKNLIELKVDELHIPCVCWKPGLAYHDLVQTCIDEDRRQRQKEAEE